MWASTHPHFQNTIGKKTENVRYVLKIFQKSVTKNEFAENIQNEEVIYILDYQKNAGRVYLNTAFFTYRCEVFTSRFGHISVFREIFCEKSKNGIGAQGIF